MTVSLAIYLGIVVTCCTYALAQGGAPERMGVAILIAGITASNLLPKRGAWHYLEVEFGILLVDLVMMAAVTGLALRAQRYWPVWWAGLKLCSVIVHLMMFAPLLMPWSYSIASAALSFVGPPLLAVATLRHRQRRTRYGEDPAWSIPAHWSEDDGAIAALPLGPR